MKIVGVRVNEVAKVEEIDSGLESMQKYVGGLIEMLPLEGELVLICNEEGKLNHLPANRVIIGKNGVIEDVIAGDFFVCSAPYDTDTFESVPDEMIPYVLEKFA